MFPVASQLPPRPPSAHPVPLFYNPLTTLEPERTSLEFRFALVALAPRIFYARLDF